MIEDPDPAARYPGQPASAAEEDQVFTIRLWLERGADPETGTWRGQVRHRGAVTHFIGLAALFDFITRTLARLPGQGGRA